MVGRMVELEDDRESYTKMFVKDPMNVEDERPTTEMSNER